MIDIDESLALIVLMCAIVAILVYGGFEVYDVGYTSGYNTGYNDILDLLKEDRVRL